MIIMLILIVMLFPSISNASAWVREQGDFFLSTSLYFYNAKKYYDKKYKLKKMPCEYDKKELQLYSEYGLKNSTTLTSKIPYDLIGCDNSENSGLGDLELGVIQNMHKSDNNSFSLYSFVIIPSGYSIEEVLRLGYNRFGIEGGFLYGKSFNWGYLDSGIGYRYYFGYPASQIRGYLLLEYNLMDNLKLFSNLEFQKGLNDGEIKDIGDNILLNTNYELYKIYLGTRINFRKLSFIFGYQDTLYGKDTGKGSGLYFSVWFNF